MKDLFSNQADIYAKYRPKYPPNLFETLNQLSQGHELALDVGTGNGQAAIGLSQYFGSVIATDLSKNQLSNAIQKSNITYICSPAETPSEELQSKLTPGTVDLVTVATALHWFNIPKFMQDIANVYLKPNGLFAAWAYLLPQVDDEQINKLVQYYFEDVIGEYWDPERKLVDTEYQTVSLLPLEEFKIKDKFYCVHQWSVDDLFGYFNSWSSTQKAIKALGKSPMSTDLKDQFVNAWGGRILTVRHPIFLKLARKIK